MECQFCHKSFSNAYTLHTHQTKTKKCIAIQQNQVTKVIDFKCMYCEKTFSTKYRMEHHINSICKIKIKTESKETIKKLTTHITKDVNSIKSDWEDKFEQLLFEVRNNKEEIAHEMKIKDDMIKTLQEKVNALSKGNVTNIDTQNVTNNNITIYQLMSQDKVEEAFKKYSLENLLGGQRGLARFVCDSFIKPLPTPAYVCGDRSRHKFYIVDEDGKKVEDTDCDQLIGLSSMGLPRVKEVYQESLFNDIDSKKEEDIQDNYRKIITLDHDRADFKNELSKIMPMDQGTLVKTNLQRCKDYCEEMRKSVLPYEKRTTSDPIPDDIPKLNEIGGISLGKLDVYRKGYRERKALHGDQAEIKAPNELIEQFKTNPSLEKKYIDFITS